MTSGLAQRTARSHTRLALAALGCVGWIALVVAMALADAPVPALVLVAVLGTGIALIAFAAARLEASPGAAPPPRTEPTLDPLTGLVDRAGAVGLLERQLAAGQAVAAAQVDIDRFRSVNDRYGVPVGDQLLRQVALRITTTMGPGETLSRIGGDELLLLRADPESRSAQALGEHVASAFVHPFDLDGRKVRIDASIGVGELTPGLPAADLLRDLDTAVLEAKRHAGTRVEPCTDGLRRDADERLAIESRLRDALESEELDVAFQPIVDPRDGRLLRCEALLRWEDDGGKHIRPAAFLPIAETTDLIVSITRFTLDRACEILGRWHREGRGIPIGVNVSVGHLVAADLLADVAAAIERHGAPPAMLEIEITESRIVESFATVAATLASIRALGCGVAIDDFGTGYSSLQYLRELPTDRVKLDRTFLATLDDARPDPRAITLLDMTTRLGRALDLIVVAEGIENEAQRLAIVVAGVDEAQGFLFHRPLTLDGLEALL